MPVEFWQASVGPLMDGTGKGFTVIVKDFDGPVQATSPFKNWGVTTIVATTGPAPVQMAEKAGISPVPLTARPILALLLVHV